MEIPTPKPEKKTKYETAAQKNLAVGPHYRVREWKTEFGLQIFMDGISGSSRMEPASDDDEGEEEEEEDNDEDEDEVEIVEAKPNKKVASKKPPAKATSNYKSAAKITTSDDESGAEERRDRASKKARVSLESGEDDESKKGKVKVEKKPKEKAEKKPEEKTKKKPRARAVKPGDAERGTAEEEEKIKQLKVSISLLLRHFDWSLILRRRQVRCGAVGNPRFFNGTTGAERTLTAVERISILDDILRGAGFNRSGGAMPSIQKCQEVGDRRALEKEMKVSSSCESPFSAFTFSLSLCRISREHQYSKRYERGKSESTTPSRRTSLPPLERMDRRRSLERSSVIRAVIPTEVDERWRSWTAGDVFEF